LGIGFDFKNFSWASELNRTFSKEEIQMTKKTHEKMLTNSSNKGNAN
jgi:hypothetical protein